MNSFPHLQSEKVIKQNQNEAEKTVELGLQTECIVQINETNGIIKVKYLYFIF